MQFYPAPCEVVEADVAGFGPRRFLTGTRLLASVWDKLVAEARRAARDTSDEDAPAWILREQGVRSLAPVAPREVVGVLLSLERLDDSATLRLDYRVVRGDGQPAACASLVFACTNKSTGSLTPLPHWLLEYCAVRGGFDEQIAAQSFVERALVLADPAGTLFPESVRAFGARVATEATHFAARRRTPTTTPLSIPTLGALDVPDGNTAFFFPDLDAYDGKLLCELRAYLPYLADYFDEAEEVARRVFRHAFLPLVDSDTLALHDQRLDRCPELAHVGVVLTGALIAELLKEHGIQPRALIGDGLGELAACAVADATELSTALRLAGMRAIATRRTNGNGDGHAAEQFAAALAEVRFEQPQLPIVSLRAHGLFTPGSAGGWVPLGRSAAIADVIAAARAAGCDHVIECGPRGLLSEAPRVPAVLLPQTFETHLDLLR